MPFRVVNLFEIRVVRDRCDPLLERNHLIVAGHCYNRTEFQAFGEMHGADGSSASGGLNVVVENLVRHTCFVRGTYRVLGTDGFGRSDYRKKLRHHFEVDRHFVTLAALKALADENKVPSTKVAEAIKKYGINPDKPSPARA